MFAASCQRRVRPHVSGRNRQSVYQPPSTRHHSPVFSATMHPVERRGRHGVHPLDSNHPELRKKSTCRVWGASEGWAAPRDLMMCPVPLSSTDAPWMTGLASTNMPTWICQPSLHTAVGLYLELAELTIEDNDRATCARNCGHMETFLSEERPNDLKTVIQS